MRLHSNQADPLYRKNGSILSDPLESTILPSLFPEGLDFIQAKYDNDLDSINLTFDQKMKFSQEKVILRAFGSIRYANINSEISANANALGEITVNEPVELVGNAKLKSDYDGIGPQAGVDAIVKLGNRFSLFGTVAASLLTGSLDQNLQFAFTSTVLSSGTTDTQLNKSNLANEISVIPELDSRIGLDYTHSFSTNTSTNISIGYEVTNYFGPVNNSERSYFDSMSHYNNFANFGPFARLKIMLS